MEDPRALFTQSEQFVELIRRQTSGAGAGSHAIRHSAELGRCQPAKVLALAHGHRLRHLLLVALDDYRLTRVH